MASQTVWTVFAATVARFGKRVAIEVQRPDCVDRFTYQQLHDLAVAHGAWLTTNGVKPGDRCAIFAHNDAHWCAVYLGILRAGATAVPLDTNYSAKQVATIINDSGARLLFVKISDLANCESARRPAHDRIEFDAHDDSKTS